MHSSRAPLTLALAALALTASACANADDATSGGSGGSSGSSSPSAASSSPAAPDTADTDTTALAAGSDWLAGEVTDGVVRNEQYQTDDYGLGIDVALALDAVDQQEPVVQAISDQLSRHVEEYTAPGFGTLTSAGGTAKAVVLAEAADADPASYGGTDLVAQLEDTVADAGPAAGRIQDRLDPKEKGAADYANVVGQAYAVRALAEVDSAEAGAATDYLLAQQCGEGWFRLDLTKDPEAADQSCDAHRTSKPDIDATAFAVAALSESDAPQAADAVESGVAWLVGQQGDDGSFGAAGAPNTNSTGLAGTALAEAGEEDAAASAATWVFERQAVDCESFDPDVVGAIAFDDAALEAATVKGVTAKTSDQFRRASAGALPVLEWLPASATEDRPVGSC